MKMLLGAVAAASLMLSAGQASAAVTFSFVGDSRWVGSYFTVVEDEAPTVNGPSNTTACLFVIDGASRACSIKLLPDAVPFQRPGFEQPDHLDIVEWVFGPGESDWGRMLFDNGVFGQIGSFRGGGVGAGTLTITDPSRPIGAVPEPATWAMMLMGFFGLGSAVRSRRRRLA